MRRGGRVVDLGWWRWLLVGVVFLASSGAADPHAAGAVGADISFPDCGTAYPSRQAFGIVGVNAGRPGTTNPCLASELQWALGSFGFEFVLRPVVSLYLNTADPGPGTRARPVEDWPHAGATAYGACRGGWSFACAYLYGARQAQRAFATAAAVDGVIASWSPWWLDVEQANSWAKRGRHAFGGLNVAAINGFLDGLRVAGALGPLGFYSIPTDWLAITGLSPKLSAQYFASQPDWVGGGATQLAADENCDVSFSRGPTVLAQYVEARSDIDVVCQ